MMIYILSKIVKYDEFLSLSFEELVKLISYDDLVIPHEEKVNRLKLIKLLYFSIVNGLTFLTYKCNKYNLVYTEARFGEI